LGPLTANRAGRGLKLGNALLASIEATTREMDGLRAPKTDEMSKLGYDCVVCLP
jgi:hypothetical protein